MIIDVLGNSYKIEYTFEAAHYKKCVQTAWNHFSGASMVKEVGLADLDDQSVMGKMMTLDSMINAASNVPEMVIVFLYAGLLENHGDDIKTEADARALYKQFCKDHPEDERAMEFGMMDAIRRQMEEDGFFKRIGLESLLGSQKAEG